MENPTGRVSAALWTAVPPGLKLDEAVIQRELDRRRPGSAGIAGTSRCESDAVRLLSGVFGGVTTGTPIAFHIANENQRSGALCRAGGDMAPRPC